MGWGRRFDGEFASDSASGGLKRLGERACDGHGLHDSMAGLSLFFFFFFLRRVPAHIHGLVGLMVCLGWLQLTALD